MRNIFITLLISCFSLTLNGVRYREIFWNPTDHQDIDGLDYETVVDSIIGGLQYAAHD
jgi:hypothetical protein